MLTILDFRNTNHLSDTVPPLKIDTHCPIRFYVLDDVLNEGVRNELPEEGMVITLTETGNRDEFVIRYLSQFGITHLKALKFGMRGWVKERYPTTY